MRKFLCLVIVLALTIPCVFAGGGSSRRPAEGAAVGGLTAEQQWAREQGLHLDESVEELYRQALAEGGQVIIYSISSRHARIKPMFEADFPGMTLTAHTISSGELLEKFTREYEAGIRAADIVHSKEQVGE